MEENNVSVVARIKQFFSDVMLEMRRSTWPDRKTLVSHTVIVIVSVLMLGLYVGVSDRVLTWLLKLI